METSFLNNIQSPADLKKMSTRQLENLCEEIREFLIDNVSKTGGHLASNLGMVELTVALHRQLNSPEDIFVFDVGHQCYTHKILTGRKDSFKNLRKKDGLSGFPAPKESKHDLFLAGHGSTSVAAAVGLARAKILKNEPGFVVAIVGDGAFTGGLVYEALNNVENLGNLIIILNDNKMSISKNQGGLASYFGKLRTSPGYYRTKNDVKNVLDNTPVVGGSLIRGISAIKKIVRRELSEKSTLFDDMGIRYIGPIDGHNLSDLCGLFSALQSMRRPLLIHVETVKGKGFKPAEINPGAFHGVSAFDHKHILNPELPPDNSFSTVFGQELKIIGETNQKLCGVVAAMTYGTGMQYFKKAFRNRFFDVGMAEQMAVTFAAGLARGGLLPVVAIYSTFLQRSYDQIIHDVVLQDINVLFAIDRAGFVPGDGETHQGLYDAAYLSQQKKMPIVSPSNYAELRFWLGKLVEEYDIPRAIRYARGEESDFLGAKTAVQTTYAQLVKSKAAEGAFVSYGIEIEEAFLASEICAKKDKPADVFQIMMINPIPEEILGDLRKYKLIVFAEEGIAQGGIGEHLALKLYNSGFKGEFVLITAPETGCDHATVAELKVKYGLDAQSLAEIFCDKTKGKTNALG